MANTLGNFKTKGKIYLDTTITVTEFESWLVYYLIVSQERNTFALNVKIPLSFPGGTLFGLKRRRQMVVQY